MKQFFFSLFFAGITILSANGQNFDPVLTQTLQNKVVALKTQYNLKGISASVVIPGQGTWAGVAGSSTTIPQNAVSSDMLFGIGSCTKNFTAALILKLQEQGLININNPVSTYISNLSSYPNINGSVTIRQLLNHTSGIGEYTGDSYFWYYTWTNRSYLFTNDNILSTIGQQQFAPGTNWNYCNSNFYLLGIIIQNVTQTDLLTAYNNYLLSPLSLGNVFLGAWETIPANVSFAHGWGTNMVTYQTVDVLLDSRNSIWSGAGSAGCLVSTAEDLAKWAQLLFNGSVINQTSVNEMTTFNSNNYGLGCYKLTSAGRTTWGHIGNIPGYTAIFIYDPACNVSSSILVNQENVDITTIMSSFYQVIVDDYCNVTSAGNDINTNNNTTSFGSFPNPFNYSTEIEFFIPEETDASIAIYDISGNIVKTFSLNKVSPGTQSIVWYGDDNEGNLVADGIYISRLTTRNDVVLIKMLINR